MSAFYESLINNPIIASIKEIDNLDVALSSPCENIFLQTGNIFNLKELSQRIKLKNKGLFISIDSIDGFSKDTWGLEYIIKNIELDGIITKKNNLVKLSKDMGVFTIQSVLIHDSKELSEGLSSIKSSRPHAIDISPGIIPKIIHKVSYETKIPIIASGLLSDKKDVDMALSSGAVGVSSSNKNIWYVNY